MQRNSSQAYRAVPTTLWPFPTRVPLAPCCCPGAVRPRTVAMPLQGKALSETLGWVCLLSWKHGLNHENLTLLKSAVLISFVCTHNSERLYLILLVPTNSQCKMTRYRCYLNSFLITSNLRKHAEAICTCDIMSVNCYKGSRDNLRTKGCED